MSRRFVNQLDNGDPVDEVFLVADRQLRTNRQGNLYLHLDLRDRTGLIGAKLWSVTEEEARQISSGCYLSVRGKVQTYQGGLQIILNSVRVLEPDSIDPADFLAQSACDIPRLVSRLREILLGLRNPHLRALAECFLIDQDFLQKFSTAPAGIKNHHAYQGGLLEHVVTLLQVADRIADLYPELDRDLLLSGAFLHDIGKIDELTYDTSFAYTDEGQLVGHLVMGVLILRDKVKQTIDLTGDPFPPELLHRLEHMIVSHHGSYEFGSPKLPMTPEAIALHHLDNLDAKIHLFTREIREDPTRGPGWTPYNQNLQRRLFKGYNATAPNGET